MALQAAAPSSPPLFCSTELNFESYKFKEQEEEEGRQQGTQVAGAAAGAKQEVSEEVVPPLPAQGQDEAATLGVQDHLAENALGRGSRESA